MYLNKKCVWVWASQVWARASQSQTSYFRERMFRVDRLMYCVILRVWLVFVFVFWLKMKVETNCRHMYGQVFVALYLKLISVQRWNILTRLWWNRPQVIFFVCLEIFRVRFRRLASDFLSTCYKTHIYWRHCYWRHWKVKCLWLKIVELVSHQYLLYGF